MCRRPTLRQAIGSQLRGTCFVTKRVSGTVLVAGSCVRYWPKKPVTSAIPLNASAVGANTTGSPKFSQARGTALVARELVRLVSDPTHTFHER